MPVTDIILEEDGSVKIANGDLVIDVADQQHQRVLLMTSPGESSQWPVDGVGLVDYLEDDEFPDKLKARIVSQFAADGMEGIRIVGTTFENLKINAGYP